MKYSYQLLRYRPDGVSEEFLNVGLVMMDDTGSSLRASAIERTGRVKALFPKVQARPFISKLKRIVWAINAEAEKRRGGLGLIPTTSLNELTSTVIPKDDSSLYFSETKRGVDISFDPAFQDLFERLVTANEVSYESHLTDRDVWTKYYQSYFQTHRGRIRKKTIVTSGDELVFEHALQNGTLNVLEPVTFDLRRESNVKDKVYRWMGRLEELDSSDETFKLYLLTKMPSNPKLKRFIFERIENNSSDNFQVKIVEPENAEEFANQLVVG